MELLELLQKAQRTLEALGVPYAVVGSMASSLYGEPRLTRDIDIVADLPLSQVEAFCATFPAPEFYVSVPAAMQAVRERGQFNIIQNTSGFKVDLLLTGISAWSKQQLNRTRQIETQGVIVTTAAPEDIILGKLQYYREGGSEKHLRDIAAMFDISKKYIDRRYIDEWSVKVGVAQEWQEVVKQLEAPFNIPTNGE